MDDFLISPAAPWLIALAVLLSGFWLWVFSKHRGWESAGLPMRVLAVPLVVAGLLLTIGATYTAIRMAGLRRANPPPGKMVEVDGTHFHVWCEGTPSGPTVLILPGGFGQALWMRHLQVDLAEDHRVCLIDRAGLGWSEMRPLPNDVETVVDEMHSALTAAGEDLPMVIIGHSFGGFYAANFAAMHPADVSAIALLDPTAPSHNIAMRTNECPGPNYKMVLGAMFGLGFNQSLNPLYGPGTETERELAGDDWETLVAFEIRPSALIGTNSALTAPCRRPLSTVPATAGRLSDLPVLQIVQTPEESADRPAWLAGLSDFEYDNHLALYAAARDDYVRMSSRSRLEYAPPDAGHGFPVTEREFTLERIRAFIGELADGSFPAQHPTDDSPETKVTNHD
jgi:pimeloyl-ACP methyl ester carboxylesterase